MLDTLDGPALRRWVRTAWRGLGRERSTIDDLNVFPVADADTGTNLHLTVESALAAVGDDDATGPSGAGEALDALARGALVGARGNSGAIVASYLRGMCVGLAGAAKVDGAALAEALASGAEQARTAVAEPVEGTILSVADAAADAARSACVAGIDDLATVAGAAAAGARSALGRTPGQLAVLAEAGVVDAGGRGLVVMLDALVATVVDTVRSDAAVIDLPASRWPVPDAGRAASPAPALLSPGFEVMYTFEADDAAASSLRAELGALGDSVVVSGGDGLWTVHVHLDDAGAAVDAGLRGGRVSGVRVTPLEVARTSGRTVVVVAPGDGLAALLTDAGATVVPAGAAAPTATDLSEALRCTRAAEVVILPSDPTVQPAAEAAARAVAATGLQVAVVPTRAVVQSLAALAVHDAQRPFHEDVVAMTAAAVSTRYGAVAQAVRSEVTTAGACAAGDHVGSVGDELVVFGPDLERVADAVAELLLVGGGELLTLVSGAGAPPGLVDGVVERVARSRPALEVLTYDGGQPDHPLLVGAE